MGKEKMECEWWEKVVDPVQRVWKGVAVRLGIRKRGILKLRHDVRACEYEDVHVMWEMLRKTEAENARSHSGSDRKEKKGGNVWNCFRWARSSPHLCCKF